MIFRIYPSKDAFITNDTRERVRRTGSNVGAAEALEVFKSPGISGAIGTLGSSSLARSLLHFETANILAASGSGQVIGVPRYFLRLNHKTSGETLPYSFNLHVYPVSSSWDEGRGMDDIDLLDNGVCNWIRPNSTSYWNSPGGDFLLSPTASMHFDTGEEDLEVDVTDMVTAWLAGTITNNGLMVKISSSVEADSDYTDLYTKKFYSRTSSYPDRRPYIEARYDDSIRDDRKNIYWARSGSLYMYNVVGGQLTNLPAGNVIVRIQDASGTLVSATASQGTRTGVYSASFALPTGSYSGSIFYDLWGSGSYSYLTSSFVIRPTTGTSNVAQQLLTANIRNLKNEYYPEETPRLDVTFKLRGHNVPLIHTASYDVPFFIAENSFYAIENDSTRDRVIPFDTGSLLSTKLSYDGAGNFFKIGMTSLHAGNVYRVLLLVRDRGYDQVIDAGLKFKVI